MDALLSLIPGGNLTVILTAIGAGLLAIWRIFASVKQSGVDKQRAKEADAYEQHLEDIADAHNARNRIDPDSVPEHDRYRRD